MLIPVCDSFEELEQHDGNIIMLKGLFRKSLTLKKMHGEGVFMGYAHIELDGRTVDVSEKRSEEEFAAYTDKKVQIQGTLQWDPYKESRESSAIEARIIFGPPKLLHVTSIQIVSE